jgi:ABC-2 type transport system ATP-binding protein
MMVGLLQPTAGRIRIGGIDAVAERREANRLLGYVPDQPYLYEKLSGREFLKFVGDLFGMSKADAVDGIEEQIAAFELTAFVDHLTESYSHGMKQRLAFAAAFLHRPKLLILDEPMVGLDPRSMRMVKDLLRRQAERGTTVFMSTHTLSIAEEIADRIGVIDHGRLLFLGTVNELRTHLSLGDESLEHLYLTLTSPPDAAAVL